MSTNSIVTNPIARENETALRIARMYIERFPRENYYPVLLESSDDDSQGTYYFTLTDDEKSILAAWENLTVDDEEFGTRLEEYLEDTGHKELIEKFLNVFSVYQLDIVSASDISQPLKFTKFGFQQLDETTGQLLPKIKIGKSLTDDEFCELLGLQLTTPCLTMNQLVYKKPELARQIFEHLAYASMNNDFENMHPFVAYMDEIRDAATSILDENTDILKLKDSEDDDLQDFISRHQKPY